MSIKPVIVAVGYNRINSMSRLLQALENAVYDEEVTLIISIDYGDNQNLIEIVNQFVWSHGEKIVKTHSKKLGLRKHVMECMDYSIEYGAAIIFEDDTMPAPYFYSYAKQAVNFYAQEERVFAISLYSQLWNGYANREFVPLKKNHDAYISQIECSWGECFIGERWKDFKNWYIRNEGKLKDSKKIPFAVCTWKESYSKYLLYYIVENNKFYVTPYDSLSTNFNNAGTHISVGTSTYQVPLLQGEKNWNFPTFEEAISYDAFFENVSIKALIEQRYPGKQVCIDYYGLHMDYENYDLCLTTKKLNRRIIQRYGLELRPPELNYIYNISGDDLYLYDLSTEKKNHLSRKHHYNMLRYDVKELHWIDSLFYTLYTWWLRIKNRKYGTIMYSKLTWHYYYIKNYIRRYVQFRITQIMIKIGHENKLYKIRNIDKVKRIAGKKQMNIMEMNIRLADAIYRKEPFWIGRFGGMERDVIISFLEEAHGMQSNKANYINGLCNNAGFFPNDEKLAERFVQMMLDVCKHMDILGAWNCGFMEDYLAHEYMKDSCATKLTYLEPWMIYFSKYNRQVKPWTYALKGKKVLVIHPFAETIKSQYSSKRTKLFKGFFDSEDILPPFELITLKAVQTQGGEIDERFNNWFDALEWMKEEVAKIKFDVAIIGCGAYGFPLAAYIKSLGKVAIHMGGSTQLMFGIKGKRWETTDGVRIFFNKEWVRPSEKETIRQALNVEDGCYW